VDPNNHKYALSIVILTRGNNNCFVLLAVELFSMAAHRSRHAKLDFKIHDEEESEEMIGSEVLSDGENQSIEELEMYEEEHDGQDDDGNSDMSEESQENIDPTVLEDMEKFNSSFQGINRRFRLINRIGEGMLKCRRGRHCC